MGFFVQQQQFLIVEFIEQQQFEFEHVAVLIFVEFLFVKRLAEFEFEYVAVLIFVEFLFVKRLAEFVE